MCLLHWSLVGDHHSGILLLLHHQNYAPAFALARPLIEAFVRLFVVIHGTEAQLAAIKNGTYRPEFAAVGKQIDELYGLERPLMGPWLDESTDGLHDFTHGGVAQLQRHKAGGDITPNFAESEVVDVINVSTVFGFLTVLEVTAFLNMPTEHEFAAQLYHEYLHPEQ